MTPLCLFIFFLKEKPTTKLSKSFDLLSDKIIGVHDFFFLLVTVLDLKLGGYLFKAMKKISPCLIPLE